jgi:hypothetical protein
MIHSIFDSAPYFDQYDENWNHDNLAYLNEKYRRQNMKNASLCDLTIEHLPNGRTIYKVGIGDLPPEVAEAFMKDLMDAHRKHIGPQ